MSSADNYSKESIMNVQMRNLTSQDIKIKTSTGEMVIPTEGLMVVIPRSSGSKVIDDPGLPVPVRTKILHQEDPYLMKIEGESLIKSSFPEPEEMTILLVNKEVAKHISRWDVFYVANANKKSFLVRTTDDTEFIQNAPINQKARMKKFVESKLSMGWQKFELRVVLDHDLHRADERVEVFYFHPSVDFSHWAHKDRKYKEGKKSSSDDLGAFDDWIEELGEDLYIEV
jgi:hypothetical protein